MKAAAAIPAAPVPARLHCLGAALRVLSWKEFISWWDRALSSRSGTELLFLANAHTLTLASSDDAYLECLNRADLLLPDGIGISLCARMRGKRLDYNFNGTDLLPKLLARASTRKRPIRVFLYGGAPEALEGASRHISTQYANVEIVGKQDGYHSHPAEVLKALASTQPDLLLVGMGNPKQEMWLTDNRDQLKAKVAIGVGGLFDFLSGTIPRAPVWMRKVGLEWFYRMVREPRRLMARYLIGGPIFLCRSALQLSADRARDLDDRSANESAEPHE